VVRSVAGGVEDMEATAGEGEDLVVSQHLQVFRWNGQKLAVEALHGIAVKPGGAVQKFRGIGHVLCADFVHVDFEAGILAEQGAGGAGVIQVNMGQ
jgi:hypothetical protein